MFDRIRHRIFFAAFHALPARNRRTVALGMQLAMQYRKDCPDDYEAIVSGAACPTTDIAEYVTVRHDQEQAAHTDHVLH